MKVTARVNTDSGERTLTAQHVLVGQPLTLYGHESDIVQILLLHPELGQVDIALRIDQEPGE